ncbi:hypothetical protein [Streptomyces colonosanans]|uniref:Uncharacterized protein n=1 Tax=Streptomyces colonosanans TaxID=1428652 RepID=A0A1S2PAU9_9ACTN|nr:hypothetical protein [Streptomyces colonosanans]OIJ90893.1 hypothetical protein BIV24_17085 [Streptomyces colonosanans]
MSNEAADLRALLEAVFEALDVDGDCRIVDRALWARITVRGALDEEPEYVGWNARYLRRKIAEEAERQGKK